MGLHSRAESKKHLLQRNANVELDKTAFEGKKKKKKRNKLY